MPAREFGAGGQVVVDAPPERPLGHEADAAASPRAARASARLRSSVLLAICACFALAALSAAVLPTVPSYDPWAWIVWGREVVDPHLSFATGGGPSWKPLPVLFTTVFGLFGGAAPTLWVITARAGGLLALVAAWRLAARLSRPLAAPLAAPIAGTIAVLGVLSTQDFFYYMFRGTSEPMLIAAALWTIDRLLERRDGQAFVIAVAAALIRPEAWPFLGVYAIWLWFARPALRPLVLAGIAAVPFLWFVPPWIGSGQPFLAASHAKQYNGHLGAHPALEALRRSADLQVLPVLIAAAVAVVWSWMTDRDRVTLALAGGALAWIALVIAMVLGGYPGLERFFLPASAVICVLAGIAVARLAAVAGVWVGSRAGPGRIGGVLGEPRARRHTRVLATVVALGVAASVIAIGAVLGSSRISQARAAKPTADRAVRILDELSAAVSAVGGHRGVYPCHSSFAAINHGVQTALAWKLHVTLARVGTAMRHPGVLFVGPHNSIDGGPAPISRRLTIVQPLARVGVWRVLRVTRPGYPSRCVGR